MKLHKVKKFVQHVRGIFHSHRGSNESRDLDEYEKVKKEYRPISTSQKKENNQTENRDISAI